MNCPQFMGQTPLSLSMQSELFQKGSNEIDSRFAVDSKPARKEPEWVTRVKSGPTEFFKWLGPADVQVGDVRVKTQNGQLLINVDEEQEKYSWLDTLPTYIKIGVPVALALFILRR